jgi:hypothetical protein
VYSTAAGIPHVSRLVKKKYQRVADRVGTYGIGYLDSLYGPGPHPFELVFALELLADRIELRNAARVIVGIRNAISTKIDKTIWEAICDTPEQVNEARAVEESVLEASKAAEGGMGEG